MRRVWLALLVVGLLLTLGARQVVIHQEVVNFDVSAEVLDDGSLRVQESLTVYYQGQSPAAVERQIPAEFTDGIVDIVAGFDGRILPEGLVPGQVEIKREDPIRIIWYMKPISKRAWTFDLSYTMLGIVRQTENADLLYWRPLPSERDYRIDKSEGVIIYPPDWPLAAQPTAFNATNRNESGKVHFKAGALPSYAEIRIAIPFQPGAILDGPPAWQAQQHVATREAALLQGEARQRQAQLAEEREQTLMNAQQARVALLQLFVGSLAVVGGAYVLRNSNLFRGRRIVLRPAQAYRPPDSLSPALAGALRDNAGKVTWDQALGALFDLAGRGFFAIEQLPADKGARRDYRIRLKTEPFELRPHEASLVAFLLNDEHGRRREAVNLSELKRYRRGERWQAWSRSLEAELIFRGLLKPGRQAIRNRALAAARAPLWLIAPLLLLQLLFYGRLGWWLLIPAGALLLLSGIGLMVAKRIPALSDAGIEQAAEWQAFHRYLKKGDGDRTRPVFANEFSAFLPYAAACGQLHSWASRFARRGWRETPAYFRRLGKDDRPDMRAFVAMARAFR